MYYGERTNEDFLLYQGFEDMNHPDDFVSMQLGNTFCFSILNVLGEFRAYVAKNLKNNNARNKIFLFILLYVTIFNDETNMCIIYRFNFCIFLIFKIKITRLLLFPRIKCSFEHRNSVGFLSKIFLTQICLKAHVHDPSNSCF